MNKLIEKIDEGYEVYIAAQEENLKQMELEPFGLKANIIDPFNPKNKGFFDMLNKLDGLAYGDKSLAMPKWVSHDCGIMPSGIIGLAKEASKTEKHVKEQLEAGEGYEGLIPISEFCAIPSMNGAWIGHTLATIEKGKGLGIATKVIGLKVYGTKKMQGIVQYDNTAIKTHTKISSINIEQAIAPARTHPYKSLVYSCNIEQDKLEEILEEKYFQEHASSLLKVYDESMIGNNAKEMHDKIKNEGATYKIVYPGMYFGPTNHLGENKKMLFIKEG